MGSEDEAESRQSAVDFYAAMAYSELCAFERFSADARFSPTLRDRIAIGKLAAGEFAHFELASTELAGLGAAVEEAMRPFQPFVDAFHERTRPADWYEALMKAYVADALSGDFYRAVADYLDPRSRDLVARIKADTGQAEVLRARLAQAVSEDARLASRLALWGRRLVAEALTQAQHMAFGTQGSGALLRQADPAERREAADALSARLTGNHSRRMRALGLTA